MPSHAKRCRYCRVRVGVAQPPTWDHLVPKWVLRAYPSRFTNHAKGANKVTACRPCNHLKGLVPAAEFLAVRHDPEAQRASYLRWARICLDVHMGGADRHRDVVYAEFGRPIPEHFQTKRVDIGNPDAGQSDWVRSGLASGNDEA